MNAVPGYRTRKIDLRLKLRKDREYTFTDPERDADRLFVFHRDVERARGLLAKGYQPATD